MLAARQPDRLEAAATEVREAQLSRTAEQNLKGRESPVRQALAIPTDVRDPEQVNNLVQKALISSPHAHDGPTGYFGREPVGKSGTTYVDLTLQQVNQLPIWSEQKPPITNVYKGVSLQMWKRNVTVTF